MTTYNTGNPLGSSDPRDLYDNAENLDNLVNGEQPAYNDRLGKSRRSWQSVEDQANQQEAEFNADQSQRASEFDAAQSDREGVFNAYLVSAGYQFAGDYAAGIQITQYNQAVRDTNGEFWRLSGSTSLPYTTTGAGLPEGGAFVAVGDAVLRQELGGDPANGQGATMVRGAVIYVATLAERDLLTNLADGQQVSVSENGYVYKYLSATDSFEILPGRFKGNDGKLYQIISAVLRQDGEDTGWYALDDSGHTPIGISSAETSADGMSIIVNYNFASQAIGSVNVTADESFAAYPMYFGPSVGGSSLNISVYHQWGLRTSGTSSATTAVMGDRDVDWSAVVDAPAGTITVTHGSSTHSDSSGWPVWAQLMNSENNSNQIRITGQSKTGYTIQNYGPLAGRIRNDLLTQDNTAETITATWDGVSKLTISHPPSMSLYDAQVTATSTRFVPAVVNASKTSIEVEYQDTELEIPAKYTGTTHPPVSLNWSRSSGVCKYPITSSTETLSGRAGPVRIPVTKLSGATRNLWISGVFEVSE